MITSPALEARGLIVGYRAPRGRRSADHAVLGPVDLELASGSLTVLVGPNGAGKSTLLRTLCGVQPALVGEVRIGGQPLSSLRSVERARLVAVVGTDRPEGDLLTVFEAVALGRHPHTGWLAALDADDRAITNSALARTGLLGLADRMITALSDGERQRVAIACALAQAPRVLVLDEPTAFLDVNRRVMTIELLLDLAHAEGLAVLLCTHDLELALPVADIVWCVAEREVSDGAGAGAFPAARSRHECVVGTLFDVYANGALARAFGPSVCHDPATGRVHIALARPTRAPVSRV